jgi:hypothetical protein
MKFLCRKDYNGKNLIGEDVLIKSGELLETQGDIIVYDRKPLFHIYSQNTRIYMVWNDDGFGIQRATYEDTILFSPRERMWKDSSGAIRITRWTPTEMQYIRENYFQFLESDSEVIAFNNYFFIGSPIEKVNELATYLQGNS